jgi:glycosyltransferase involved in cell wall biosynthesis
LALVPDGNPDSLATALVGYAHAAALAQQHDVTLVVRSGNEAAVRRAGAPFRALEPIRVRGLDEFYAWSLRRIFKYDYGKHTLTAFSYPFVIAFEWCAWRRLKRRIRAGEWDVVLRLLPVTSVLPTAFGAFLRKGPIPLVIGPINGGLPWPQGFVQAERQREWISGLRNVYRYLPFARSSFRNAAAIIAGSSHTFAEFESYRDKLFFVPENGLDIRQLRSEPRLRRPKNSVLRLIFVGRLVPYKACDLAIRGAAPLLRDGRAVLTILGDGPDRGALEQLSRSLSIDHAVTFAGMVTHTTVMETLKHADILVFPSIREFGGGVVFEALAAGVVPIVAAFGGPGDIVNPNVGFAVPLTSQDQVVSDIGRILEELARDPARLEQLSSSGLRYSREQLTWEGKARTVAGILSWAAGSGKKPDLPSPRSQVVSLPAVERPVA